MAKPETSKQIGVRVFREQVAWLEAESERRRVPVAAIVREAVDEKMRREATPRRRAQ